MSSEYELSYKDYDHEVSRCKFHIVDLTAGNLVATQALLASLLTAIQDLVVGELQAEKVVLSNTKASGSPASSKQANRETKWLVTYEDSTTHFVYRGEIPTADLSLRAGNSSLLDLTAGVGLAFKTAFEAVVKSRAGNAVTVISVQDVSSRL